MPGKLLLRRRLIKIHSRSNSASIFPLATKPAQKKGLASVSGQVDRYRDQAAGIISTSEARGLGSPFGGPCSDNMTNLAAESQRRNRSLE